MMNLLTELEGVSKVAMAGHLRPDGDAIGACIGLCHYLRENVPGLAVTVYMEDVPPQYHLLRGADEVRTDFSSDEKYEVFFALDCADASRLGKARKYFDSADRTICIDHHVSNPGYADANVILPDASSTSEIICGLLDEERISVAAAEALYLGIVHDTGVFRHSCTAPETMEMAAKLMRRGIDSTRIINESFYDKTYVQNQLLGRALSRSVLLLNGKIIFSYMRMKEMELYGAVSNDMEGIVETLMGTTGTEASIFMYETAPDEYKVSMRSRDIVDCSVIAKALGGGGHVRAAGCSVYGEICDAVDTIAHHMEEQILNAKEEKHA